MERYIVACLRSRNTVAHFRAPIADNTTKRKRRIARFAVLESISMRILRAGGIGFPRIWRSRVSGLQWAGRSCFFLLLAARGSRR